jgi:hypothetical protein
MSKTNNFVFYGLLTVAWIIFVALCIEAGGLAVNFFISLYAPHFIPNLYNKMDVVSIYESNKFSFFVLYGFILTIASLKVYLFYVVIMLMHRMDLRNPFSEFVSSQISRISWLTVTIGVLGVFGQQFVGYLARREVIDLSRFAFWNDSDTFIVMGAVIYIIAMIFRRGLELQNENDLTV